MRVVVDASAVLALLLDEPGADRVAALLNGSLMSSVNFSEVVGFYARAGAFPDDINIRLAALPIEIVPVDRALAFQAGVLLPLTAKAGLSLGDRSCLALGKREALTVLTADAAWQTITRDVGVAIELIR